MCGGNVIRCVTNTQSCAVGCCATGYTMWIAHSTINSKTQLISITLLKLDNNTKENIKYAFQFKRMCVDAIMFPTCMMQEHMYTHALDARACVIGWHALQCQWVSMYYNARACVCMHYYASGLACIVTRCILTSCCGRSLLSVGIFSNCDKTSSPSIT